MQAVNQSIRDQLKSDVVLIPQIGEHIIGGGGKRLRPMICTLAARCGSQFSEHAISLAAIIEFIHTATLLHDDVVDESSMRRGQNTANTLFGNAASVLVGDFLYSRAFQMMVAINSMDVMKILADTTNTISEGEVLQLINTGDPDTTESRYYKVIEDKTARLFSAAAQLGGQLGGLNAIQQQSLATYGMQLGIAFQIVDDILDYTANAEDMGKNPGDDLAEGKPTLPLLHALKYGTEPEQKLIRSAIAEPSRDFLSPIMEIIERHNSLEYSAVKAQSAAELAKASLRELPSSNFNDALAFLADYAVARTF
ncbi:MAG: polyprenyl synthetase family protein [bacterium]